MVEAIEALRAHCLATDPRLGEYLRHPALPWQDLPPVERRTLLVAAAGDSPLDSPADRRRARDIAAQITAGELDVAPGGLRPEALGWVSGEGLFALLRDAPGPVSAVTQLRKAIPRLPFARAARFLVLVGYPCAVASPAVRRFLDRMGLASTAGKGMSADAGGLQALNDLSIQTQVPLVELHYLVAAFTTVGNPAAVCVAKPKCQECPLAGHCPTGRAARHLGVVGEDPTANRNLTQTMPEEERPREKLLHLGSGALSNSELVAILLRSGSRGRNAVDLGRHLLAQVDGLDALALLSVDEMKERAGLGEVQAITIKAALELARRVSAPRVGEADRVNGARRVFERFRSRFLNEKKEHFFVLLLTTKNEVIREVEVSHGTLNQSLVHPREAFQEALRSSAHSVIFVHNHPSGDPTPSRDDHSITHRLVQAGEVLGIRVLDHVVIGRDSYYSFADDGRLSPGG